MNEFNQCNREVETFVVSPIEISKPNPLTVSLSGLSGALIGVSTVITVFIKWYTKLIPVLRRFIPNLLKIGLDDWLYDLSYRLIMRNESIKSNFSDIQVKNILSNIDVLVDLIELEPSNITSYLSNYFKNSVPTVPNTESSTDFKDDSTQLEREANELLRNLPDAPQIRY